MAWYYGTYSCGHEGRTDITGPVKNRQWIADRRFEGLCPECYQKQKEDGRAKASSESADKAKEQGLPKLTGTEKQVAWAETLRLQMFEVFEKFNERDGIRKHQDTYDHFMTVIKNESRAKWFIDNRFELLFLEEFVEMMERYLKKNEPAIMANNESDEPRAIDAKTEATVMPKNAITVAVAEIKVSNDKIIALFEKNDTFISVIKSLDYKWSGSVWERNINELTGTAADRAAELGNKLLNAGIPIIIMDESIREAAIKGEYEPECNRWVLKVKDEEKLKIKWWEKNDRLYQVARKLPGSKWDSGVIINIAHYKEVEEFASLYGFEFAENARKAIENEKERLANITTVRPVTSKVTEEKDGLKEILNSGSDIIDDLKD